MSKWPNISFLDAIEDVTRLGTKIQARNYQSSGLHSIYDQGQNEVGGYTNASEGVFSENLPVVIFGDHTRAVKLADRPFFLGADGVKILRPRIDTLDSKFLFHVLGSAELPNHGYSRHFKFLKEIAIPLPPLDDQRRIVDLLERAAGIRRLREQALAKARAIVPALFLDMFGDPVSNPKGWPRGSLGSVAIVGSGSGFPKSYQGKKDLEIPFLKVSDMNLVGNEESILSWNNTVDEPSRRALRARAYTVGTIIFPKIGAAIATNKKRILANAVLHR